MSSSAAAPTVASIETSRRESQRVAFKLLAVTKLDIDELEVPSLSDSHLERLNIRKLPEIDVDETAPFDPEPLFFRPFPLDGIDDLPKFMHGALHEGFADTSDEWKKPCEEPWCPGFGNSSGFDCSSKRFKWIHATAGRYWDGILGKTRWGPKA